LIGNDTVLDFCSVSMQEIIQVLKETLKSSKNMKFQVVNPDIARGKYAGERLHIDDIDMMYRPLRSWVDLAGLLMCRMRVPKAIDEYRIEIEFERLSSNQSFHLSDNGREKYGADSPFAVINKSEEPAFLWAYTNALKAVGIINRDRVLDIGINDGDEFMTMRDMLGAKVFESKSFVGIDYCSSAIEIAKQRLSTDNVDMICVDIAQIESLELGKFDLIVSIGTLQSRSIEMKPLVMSLVQNYLSEDGAIIFGFPSSRWIDGELIYGAKAPNYGYPELSLVIKDIYWIKKYLQQHKFRVTITGREYLFLTATKIGV